MHGKEGRDGEKKAAGAGLVAVVSMADEVAVGVNSRRTRGEERGSVEGAREGAEALGDRWREVDQRIGPVGKTRWSSGCGVWWDGDPELGDETGGGG